jgi:hypothetical protein
MTVASVEICESNTGSQTVTHNPSNFNFGSVDAPNIVVADFPIMAPGNSFEKWLRYHLVLINDSNKIDNFKVWMTPDTVETGLTFMSNLSTTLQNDVYATPVNSVSTKADLAMPTTQPGTQNIGVSAGSGGLSTNNTFSDYIVLQLQAGGSTPPGNKLSRTFNFMYDEQ